MSEYIYGSIGDPLANVLGEIYLPRVEVVRCRDCKHYDPHPTDGGVCFLPDGDGDFARWEVEPDGYCAWAERRTDDN